MKSTQHILFVGADEKSSRQHKPLAGQTSFLASSPADVAKGLSALASQQTGRAADILLLAAQDMADVAPATAPMAVLFGHARAETDPSVRL